MGKIAISFEKKKKLESTKIVSEINENPFYENKRKKTAKSMALFPRPVPLLALLPPFATKKINKINT